MNSTHELDITSMDCPLALLTVKRWLRNINAEAVIIFKNGRDSDDILKFIRTQPYQIVHHQVHTTHQQLTIKANRTMNV